MRRSYFEEHIHGDQGWSTFEAMDCARGSIFDDMEDWRYSRFEEGAAVRDFRFETRVMGLNGSSFSLPASMVPFLQI